MEALKTVRDLVREGSLSAVDDVRNSAECELIDLRNKNPASFMFECTKMMRDTSEQESLRIVAATMMRISLKETEPVMLSEFEPGSKTIWESVPEDLKEFIKQECLSELESPSRQMMEAASQVVSELFLLEVNRGAWQGLLSSLSQALVSEKMEYRIPSIVTLGYVCEGLSSASCKVPREQSEAVLAGLVFCMRREEPIPRIRLAAAKAFRDSIGYHICALEEQSEVSEVVFERLVVCSEDEEGEIARVAIEALAELVVPLYSKLERYFGVISKYLVRVVEKAESKEELRVISMEVFGVVARAEQEVIDRQKKVVWCYCFRLW